MLTPERARYSLNKNLVTRALGIEESAPGRHRRVPRRGRRRLPAVLGRPDRHGRRRRDRQRADAEARRPRRPPRPSWSTSQIAAADVTTSRSCWCTCRAKRSRRPVGSSGGSPDASRAGRDGKARAAARRRHHARHSARPRTYQNRPAAGTDLCLPYAAVSGEHAVVVDLRVGRDDRGPRQHEWHAGQRQADRAPPSGRRRSHRHRTAAILVPCRRQCRRSGPGAAASLGGEAGRRRQGRQPGGGEPRGGDTIVSATRSSDVARAAAPPPIDRSTAPAKTAELWLSAPGPSGSPVAGNPAVRLRNGSAPNAIATEESISTVAAPAPAFVGPILRVLTGPSAGRSLMVTRNEALIGRVGTQVAAIRKADEEFRRR